MPEEQLPDQTVKSSSQNEDAQPQQQATKKRRRRTRRPQPPADGDASPVEQTEVARTNGVYQLDITDLQDDVVPVDSGSQTRLEISTERSQRFRESQTASFIPSLASELIFIEQRSGFRVQTVEEMQSRQAARMNLAAIKMERMRNVANTRIVRNTLCNHKMFSRLAHLFEGLLAGFALYHFVVLVYNLLLDGSQSTISFIISYAPMAQVYTGTLHCFLAFATLRSFYPIEYLRRLDPSSSNAIVPSRRAVLIRNLPLIIIYLTAIGLNASLDSVSRQFSLVSNAPGLVLQRRFAQQIQSTVESFWLPASMSLCLLILLAWCISTLAPPSADRTKHVIQNRVDELSRFMTTERGTAIPSVNSVYSA